jgi:hypothetical protein
MFTEECKKRFPHLTYGTKVGSETHKKSFPSTFKRYFFKQVKCFIKTPHGLKKLKNIPTMFILPGGKKCTIH